MLTTQQIEPSSSFFFIKNVRDLVSVTLPLCISVLFPICIGYSGILISKENIIRSTLKQTGRNSVVFTLRIFCYCCSFFLKSRFTCFFFP